VIALDGREHGNAVMKNVVLSTSSMRIPLKQSIGDISYLNSYEQWLIYGVSGQYYRQEFP
jgi:hypothetical protein